MIIIDIYKNKKNFYFQFFLDDGSVFDFVERVREKIWNK